ncbi:hypothetical protein HMPREF0569_0374 [Micrococcus luteus SK58]|nr:hypothetical protein HMPREF0569_0374 [Micrococcus luteus SK58]
MNTLLGAGRCRGAGRCDAVSRPARGAPRACPPSLLGRPDAESGV